MWKKSLISIFLSAAILIMNVVPAFSAESNVDSNSLQTVKSMSDVSLCIAPSKAIKALSEQVNALEVSSFVNKSKGDKSKKELLDRINRILSEVKDGKLKDAVKDLDKQLKKDIYKQIVPGNQTKLIESIDNCTASINDALKTTVLTQSGYVAGFDGKYNAWTWTGIPYAKPPVGELRWRAPQDPEPWKNIRYSMNFTKCTQPGANQQWVSTNDIIGSEDCLYLNVYRPKTDKRNLPVYFWIHGGGNITGGANDYYASVLSGHANAVVVVIQYRLGPLGWFSNPALNTKGTVEEKSGNFGTLDQIKALKWVRNNIENFGGDPQNVTIGGESAGGFNTLNLLISPLAKGLFNKAVVESAGGTDIPVSEGVRRSNLAIDRLLMKDGKCKDLDSAEAYRTSMTNEQIEAYLKGNSSEKIVQAFINDDGSMAQGAPFTDGVVLPGTVSDVIESGKYNHVPVIIGTNESEMKSFLPSVLGSLPTSSGHKWGEIYNAIGVSQPAITLEELMPSGGPDRELYEACGKYPSMYWKAGMSDSIARSLRKHQDNVYSYQFKWGGKGSGNTPFDYFIGAGHGFELSFFFGWDNDIWNSNSYTDENKPGRTELKKDIMTYLASFINSGDPNRCGYGLPKWEKWSNNADGPKSIIFDADFSRAKLSMSNEELTRVEVMNQIEALPSSEKDMVKWFLWY
ncbi:MAG TPA: carboxylesterase family protein [Clostridia bacterium]